MTAELQSLENDPDLAALESLLRRFNLFEAIGMTRQEIRHSRLLAFLLDPHQTHGLGERFLRGFLQALSVTLPDTDLSDVEVFTEWENIDILIRCPRTRLAIVIENKIGAGEHGDQLARYRETVTRHFGGWTVLSIFLSPLGALPTNPDYQIAEYNTIVTLTEELALLPELDSDVITLLRHYSQMLRRHVLHEDELDALCQQLYQRHRRAFDLIFERRADPHARIREELEHLVRANPVLQLDYAKSSARSQLSFAPVAWDALLPRGTLRDWSAEGRILLFWFTNRPQSLRISLQISAGTDPEDRARLIAVAEAQGSPFAVRRDAHRAAWSV